jgi:hypothetical protein
VKKYLLLFIAPPVAELGPETLKQEPDLWLSWYKKNRAMIIDPGAPIAEGAYLDQKFTLKNQNQIASYSIVRGENLDSVHALVFDHPHLLSPSARIEALELTW